MIGVNDLYGKFDSGRYKQGPSCVECISIGVRRVSAASCAQSGNVNQRFGVIVIALSRSMPMLLNTPVSR